MSAAAQDVPCVVVIGYGNPHRQDDRAGHVVAETVAVWAAEEGRTDVRVITGYQLDLDMVEELRGADVVYFCDAHVLSFSDEVAEMMVEEGRDSGFTTHVITPRNLLALCRELYQRAPRGVIVSVPGEKFDMGDEMSGRAQEKAMEAAQRVIEAIESKRHFMSFGDDTKC